MKKNFLGNNVNEEKALAEMYSIASQVLGHTLMDKVRMDAIEEAQKKYSCTKEKLEFISGRINDATNELLKEVPAECSNLSDDEKLKLCRNMGNHLALSIQCCMWDAREGYFSHSFKGTEQELDERSKELFDYRCVDRFMTDIERMMSLLLNVDFENRVEIMDRLMLLTDATLEKASAFWSKWKHEVDDVEQNISLVDILGKTYATDNEEDAGFRGYERLLPEVITTYYLTDFYACDELLNMQKEKGQENEIQNSDLYLAALQDLEKGTFWNESIPLTEQISSFHARFVRYAVTDPSEC